MRTTSVPRCAATALQAPASSSESNAWREDRTWMSAQSRHRVAEQGDVVCEQSGHGDALRHGMHWISDVDVDADAHVHSGQCVIELDADARVFVLDTDDLGRHRGDVQREAVRHVDARDAPDAPDLCLDVRTVVVEIKRQEVRVAGGSTSVKRGQEHSTLEHERIAIINGKACAGSPPARRAPRITRSPVPLHGRSTAGRGTARRRTDCD